MMRRSVLAWIGVALAVAACGLDLTGTSDATDDDGGSAPSETDAADAFTPNDDAPPAIPPSEDAAIDSPGSRTDGGVDATPDTSPPPRVYVCPSGSTTDCASCTGRPLSCVMCASDGTQYSVCVPPNTTCYGSYKPAGYDWCRCSPPDASACILPDQGCNSYSGGVCVTCGEQLTDGDPCKRGGHCNQAQRKCQ
jgi:hypothetical protein